MTISQIEIDESELVVERVSFDDYYFHLHMRDGRILTTPLWWYPRLYRATPQQRENWQVMPIAYGVEWEDIDEHISARGILMGKPAPGAVKPMMEAAE